MSVAIVKWQRLTEPAGKTIGFTAISWHGLIVDAFAVSEGPRGLFVSMPRRRASNGLWLKVARFRTVAEEDAFRREVLAALMRTYPEDFVGYEAEPLRR